MSIIIVNLGNPANRRISIFLHVSKKKRVCRFENVYDGTGN